MIGTISPMVDGERKAGRRAAAHWAHLGGTVVGGAVAGGAIGLIGAALLAPGLAAVVTLGFAGLYGLHEFRILRMPTPERRQQVPVSWRKTLPTRATAAAYGLVLGAGFLTHITATTYYVMWLAAVATGVPFWAVIVGATYGAARGLPPFLLASTPKRHSEVFDSYERLIRGDGRMVHAANGLVLAAVVALVGIGLVN